ncbi:MAG: GHMP kinase [Flavobacteriaceae bacterium]|nr:GHMP kinase [Bacteroidia bacterium]NNF74500.1 GHMP kinase [Flavobacteriaceae bacterium]
MKTFYSHGKLLISGEYLVLDGASALALPTRYGQSMTVESIDSAEILWISRDNKGITWYDAGFDISKNQSITSRKHDGVTKTIIKLFEEAITLNPQFLKEATGYKISCRLEFPQDWGLGSSSTLINNFAQWAEVDPFELSDRTLGGSGYDIACAQSDSAIIYRRTNRKPQIETVSFDPVFKEHLYFVHLNKKQDSREAISVYSELDKEIGINIPKIDELTKLMVNCTELNEFISLIERHEQIMSEILKRPTVRDIHFSDFQGGLKSLGAWGGDFILVASETEPADYFSEKGFTTIIPYEEMVL